MVQYSREQGGAMSLLLWDRVGESRVWGMVWQMVQEGGFQKDNQYMHRLTQRSFSLWGKVKISYILQLWIFYPTYRERSILVAGWIAILLSVGLCTPVERQVMFTGLAGIVLSVWHSVFCGNSVLWRWWERDGSKRLNHCVRSCCWLLVTLEQATGERTVSAWIFTIEWLTR